MEKSVKNWVEEHIEALTTIIIIFVGNIIGYAKLLSRSEQTSERVKSLEESFEKHTDQASNLHRNPDFERRIELMDSTLKRIEGKVDQLLSQRRN
jgi:hypothetical protein